MPHATRLLPNFYRDSVSLMQLSSALGKLPGVEQVSVIMATPANLGLLRDAGLLTAELRASPNDLLVAVQAKSTAALSAAIAEAERALREEPRATGGDGAPAQMAPRSLEMALEQSATGVPAANLALISTPGEYAAAEAMKALRLGLNVMLFSDNVCVEDEIALKTLAHKRGLLVMGPDCGTAIINGVPLAFANVVRRGSIGCVGASGTGLQQVTCLVDRQGMGISQAIGTGGHDLHASVGGITMLAGIEALGRDPQTKVIVLISKPPAPEVAKRVLAAASKAGKPVVVNFVGADPKSIAGRNLYPVKTLEDAARAAVALAKGRKPALRRTAGKVPAFRLAAGQRYVRGLYSGGTFCYEASLLLGEALDGVRSNAPVNASQAIGDPWRSEGHTVIDLGDDVFTRGRPHPMIDHRLRNERILKEAADPEVAVILFDVVLGYGAHADPAAEMAPVLAAARSRAAKKKRRIAFVGFVCGTSADPQDLARQEAALQKAGVLLAASNAQAVMLAAGIAARGRAAKQTRTGHGGAR
jgi:succinyl-CoA synthetase alpha subunit